MSMRLGRKKTTFLADEEHIARTMAVSGLTFQPPGADAFPPRSTPGPEGPPCLGRWPTAPRSGRLRALLSPGALCRASSDRAPGGFSVPSRVSEVVGGAHRSPARSRSSGHASGPTRVCLPPSHATAAPPQPPSGFPIRGYQLPPPLSDSGSARVFRMKIIKRQQNYIIWTTSSEGKEITRC